jgi:hypothetical protein
MRGKGARAREGRRPTNHPESVLVIVGPELGLGTFDREFEAATNSQGQGLDVGAASEYRFVDGKVVRKGIVGEDQALWGNPIDDGKKEVGIVVHFDVDEDEVERTVEMATTSLASPGRTVADDEARRKEIGVRLGCSFR